MASKIEPKHVEYGCGIEHYDNEGRIIRADFEDFSVLSVYVPSASNIERLDFKLQFAEDFLEYIKRVMVIVMVMAMILVVVMVMVMVMVMVIVMVMVMAMVMVMEMVMVVVVVVVQVENPLPELLPLVVVQVVVPL